MAAFIRADRRPAISAAAAELLATMTPVDVAGCVPFVSIVHVDPRTYQPVDGSTAFDLARPPKFGDVGRASDRPDVSLKSVHVATKTPNGDVLFRELELAFTVHRPGAVDDSPWRSLLREGAVHMLEYGWSSNSKNDLFNGHGLHDPKSGRTVPARRRILFQMSSYTYTLKSTGEVDFTIRAKETVDTALRYAMLGDTSAEPSVLDSLIPRKLLVTPRVAVGRMAVVHDALDRLPRQKVGSRVEVVLLGDVLDALVAPLVEKAGLLAHGSVKLYLGNFNVRCPPVSADLGGAAMAGQSIASFPVRVEDLRKNLGNAYVNAGTLSLWNFFGDIINGSMEGKSWAPGATGVIPSVKVKTETIGISDGARGTFVMSIIDVKDSLVFFDKTAKIVPEEITREKILAKVAAKGMPIVKLGHGLAYLLDATFSAQADSHMQAVFFDQQGKSRKDRVSVSVEAQDGKAAVGQSRVDQFMPLGILQGELRMLGNFVFETFASVWIDFLGSAQLSSQLNVLETTDLIAPGEFVTVVKLQSDGSDPFNVRGRLTREELIAADQRVVEAPAPGRKGPRVPSPPTKPPGR